MQKLPINPFLDFYSTHDAMIINPFVFGGGAFDPLTLSPALWLDASDASTLYDAVSGGSLVAADGAIARIEDKSGNARHATQSTSGERPVRKTAILNGKDVARFDGARSLITADFGLAVPFTVFLVWQSTSSADQNMLDGLGTTLSNRMAMFYAVGSRNGFYGNGASYILGTTLSSPTGWKLSGVITGATSSTLYLDGAVDGTGGGPENPLGISIGRSQQTGFSNYLIGDIAEILVFPTALSTTDRQAVENYLNAKYAIY